MEIAPRSDLIEAVFFQTTFERCDRQGSTSRLLPFPVSITFGSGAYSPAITDATTRILAFSSPSEFSWLSVHSPITELLPGPVATLETHKSVLFLLPLPHYRHRISALLRLITATPRSTDAFLCFLCVRLHLFIRINNTCSPLHPARVLHPRLTAPRS
jgi:hypothetical protein